MATMTSSKLQVKRGAAPDESRAFAGHGHADIHNIGEAVVMRAVFEPGWKWSNDVGPIAGTKSCQAAHLGYVLSGRMRIRMDDGSEAEVGAGDFLRVAPGHDAWVLGDEPCVMVDFGEIGAYARAARPAPKEEAARPEARR
jgi:hypothetical protein